METGVSPPLLPPESLYSDQLHIFSSRPLRVILIPEEPATTPKSWQWAEWIENILWPSLTGD
jgi:hypothetical protein